MIHTKTIFVITCDGVDCDSKFYGLSSMTESSTVFYSGFSTEDGKHFCNWCDESDLTEDLNGQD
jgi:hypothetical protein